MYAGKKVLVAGGTGLIGRPLVEMLLAQGAEVRIASMDDASRAHPDAEFRQQNLLSFSNCLEVCAGMDYVFNLLGVKGSPAVTNTRPASFFVPTMTLDTNLLEAARQQGVARFLFTSSIGVYSPAPLMQEDAVWSTFPSPNDRFAGWAKRMGELQCEAYRIEFGWDEIAVVRPGNTYGPLDNFEPPNAMVVPSLIRRAVEGESPFVVWGDGSAQRDFVHARDVARGMLLALEKTPPEPINLGTGEPISVKELVETVLGCLDERPEIHWDTSKPSGDALRILDITRARELLGYEPLESFAAGIRETFEWYRDNRVAATKRYDVFAPGNERQLVL